MTLRVQVEPGLLRWACERSRGDLDALARRFVRLSEWMSGELQPTMKQLEEFARATHTPLGYLFLAEPPDELLPIPDLRTIGDRRSARPSADLLDVVHECQRRQAWYREFALGIGARNLDYVGSASTSDDVRVVAGRIRQVLGVEAADREVVSTWEEAFRRFRRRADDVGILVMASGIVGSNTHRALDPEEFRGFALVDSLAPLVFVNAADVKAAQMFTLAHEIAHVWLGSSGVSEVGGPADPTPVVERWCNRVAGEILVPDAELLPMFDRRAEVLTEAKRLAHHFKVSSLVLLRRLLEDGLITSSAFDQAYRHELARFSARPSSSGGDFYATLGSRLGERFIRSVAVSALEGETLYRDAFRLLGVSSSASFDQLTSRMGIA